MKRGLMWVVLVWVLSGFSLAATAGTITKNVNEYGEIEYSSQWKPGGTIEEVKLVKYQREKGHDEWRYLLHITVVKPKKLSAEPALLISPKWEYEIETFYTDDNNWRPYNVGLQTPQKTDQIITELGTQDRLTIKIILADGAAASAEMPTSVLQEWRSLIALRLQ